MSDWPALDRIGPEPQIDQYILMERQWRRDNSRPRRKDKHDPLFGRQLILELAHAGSPSALDFIAFNRAYPTRRHWHHAVHSEFGVPCDDLCKPKSRYTGSNLIQRIKNAYRLEEVAGRLTRLRGNGNHLHGKCPLHGEQRGEAFSLWVDSQKWKCFGQCGIGGDVIDLVRACKERGIVWNAN